MKEEPIWPCAARCRKKPWFMLPRQAVQAEVADDGPHLEIEGGLREVSLRDVFTIKS